MSSSDMAHKGWAVIGVAWYRKDQWDELLRVSDDRRELEATYGEWLIEARMTLHRLRGEGMDVRQVNVDVDDLVRWRREWGLRVTAATRAQYVAEKLNKEHPTSVQ